MHIALVFNLKLAQGSLFFSTKLTIKDDYCMHVWEKT